ncbi:hypothetical protein BU26DRAFT_254020 [Trematosphaeria pertusa]|uniref:Uncharacterized protein n=1 Tax=Trematosphaeria pertusa TaxID=390896 RepID=A0A6A6IRM6_9PLEO|nr:uncharacterized protein BU26DRAFT_254020 [Trematosphaeria pertusa]KAF2252250.1 hypothetical protein BU26DRAFT_254020 [Trematosphaeria pertusa]
MQLILLNPTITILPLKELPPLAVGSFSLRSRLLPLAHATLCPSTPSERAASTAGRGTSTSGTVTSAWRPWQPASSPAPREHTSCGAARCARRNCGGRGRDSRPTVELSALSLCRSISTCMLLRILRSFLSGRPRQPSNHRTTVCMNAAAHNITL